MGKGYDGRKASRVKTGHIRAHVILTRRAAAYLPHKYIETPNVKKRPNPHLLPDSHQAITLFKSQGWRTQTQTNRRLEEIDDSPFQTKILPKGRIQNPTSDVRGDQKVLPI